MLVILHYGSSKGGWGGAEGHVLPFATCPVVGGEGACNGALPESNDIVSHPEHAEQQVDLKSNEEAGGGGEEGVTLYLYTEIALSLSLSLTCW